MPTLVRRDADRYGGFPAAVLSLVGPYDLVRYGYGWGNLMCHIEGQLGPRGGRRTMCGRSMRSNWGDGEIVFPIRQHYAYRDRQKWARVCPDCKTGLGLNLNA